MYTRTYARKHKHKHKQHVYSNYLLLHGALSLLPFFHDARWRIDLLG